MTDTVDTIIIGAGVVGLAIARKMALAGDEVIVLEAEAAIESELEALKAQVRSTAPAPAQAPAPASAATEDRK